MKNLIINARKIQIQKFFPPWTLFAGLIITAVFYSAGCASARQEQTAPPFSLVGADCDAYIFAPVKGNEPLLSALLGSFVPEKTAAQYLSRTSVLYAGFRYGIEPSVCLVSRGVYPAALAGLLFSKKNGWEKRRAADAKHIIYYHSDRADLILPSDKIAAVLVGKHPRKTGIFLKRLTSPENPVLSSRFETFIAAEKNGIALYIPSGNMIAAQMIGLQDIELPLTSIELYLQKSAAHSYRCDAVFAATNERTAFLLKMLLSTVLGGTLSVQDAAVFWENADITEERIAELLTVLLR